VRVLVTGGAGFIGSHLVRGCLEAGDEVRVLDDFSTGRREKLSAVKEDVAVIEGTVTDLATVRRAAEGCGVIHHLAALPSVPLSVEDPVGTHHVNATGTLHVLEAARELGVHRVVYSSSCAVYGDSERLPASEDGPVSPLSPYALQKRIGELYAERFAGLYGLETVALRYFNVYGPGQDADSAYAAVIPRFLTAVSKGEPPRIHGDGRQSRDFVYVGDVVRANLAAAGAPSEVSGECFNVAGGTGITILDLLGAVGRALGHEGTEAEHVPPRQGDVRQSVADVGKARERLGWRATTSLEEGLGETARGLAGGLPA
jgi:UDP-glucose 4-epimerase